tara:strand:- start:5739 stop:6770 length:1032 start_codon:yes stop_codon:yes gene_type:complete
MIDLILKGQVYLFLIVFVMMIAGMIKDNNLFSDVFTFLKRSIKSNRAIVAMFSALTGILPIKGRVTVSAGLLDTMAPKNKKSREKFGPIDFMSTHHYYFWSPLEKTVILPMAAFGLSYGAFIGIIWPLLAMTVAYVLSYLVFAVKDKDIALKNSKQKIKISRITRYVLPYLLGVAAIIAGVNFLWAFGLLTAYYMIVTQTFDFKKLIGYVDWKIVAWVAGIIFLSNVVRTHTGEINSFLQSTGLDITTAFGFIAISLLSFIGAFALGSSSRFGAITVLLTSIYGMEYLPWFFAVDFAGYVMSPMHKCVAIGKMYFGTKLSTYGMILTGWSALLIATAGVLLWI